MKTKFASIKSLGGYLRLGAAVGAALLSCGAPLHTRAAAFDSPVGQPWDVVMGGRHLGLAVFTFSDGGTPDTRTFSVGSILVPKPQGVAHAGPSDDGRGSGDDSRTGGGLTNVPPLAPDHTNVFGIGVIPRPDNPPGTAVESGQWGFDAKGRLVGYYTDVSDYTICQTNEVLINTGIGVVTNLLIECARVTNAISFVGTVTAGKRLTLAVSTPDGKSVFTGVPVSTVNMPDLSGNYTAVNLQDTLPHTEFFTLTRNDPAANVYAISGTGPGYLYGGTAILSKSGKFAFAVDINPPILLTEQKRVRSVIGTLNKAKINFSTGGIDLLAGNLDLPNHRVRFTGVRTSTPD